MITVAPINTPQGFQIVTNGQCGPSDVSVSVMSPIGLNVKSHVLPLPSGTLGVSFVPSQLGEYLVTVAVAGQLVTPSPLSLLCIGPTEPGRVRVSGAGLLGGHVGRQATFLIDTREAGVGGLGVSIEGPEEVPITCHDNLDGTCLVSYFPTQVGCYGIRITFNDKEIPGSPFDAHIHNLSAVRVWGPGIQPQGTRKKAFGSVFHLSRVIPLNDLSTPTIPPSSVNTQTWHDDTITNFLIPTCFIPFSL